MARSPLHRIERDGRRFVLDTDTCFCFECDGISWDVLEHYPGTPTNQIAHLLREAHPAAEVEEVIGELEWLRSTKSILPLKKPKEQIEALELRPGLRQVDVVLGGTEGPGLAPGALCDAALTLLLGRSAPGDALGLAVQIPDVAAAGLWLKDWGRRAFATARVAGKQLSLTVAHIDALRSRPDTKLAGHGLDVTHTVSSPESLEACLGPWIKAQGGSLAKMARAAAGAADVEVGARITPGHGDFAGAVSHVQAQGFARIEIDVPGAYAGNAGGDMAGLTHGMEAVAVYYAKQLLKKNYFRLEPVAGLFHQIYEGTARPRADQSGTHVLAVDATGDIYPSRYFIGAADYRLGNLFSGDFDEVRRGEFDDLGSLTTSPCGSCWARNLCGGGHSAIHHALSGAIRRPEAAWCERQRDWFGAAIAAFNLLSAEGVDFSRLYRGLRPGKRPSLWGMARAALTMKVGLRPIEEADAPLLTRWENWSEATYFLGNEYGLFLATRYDREMDSLHPRGIEQEFMIVSRRGEPLGLLKVRPDRLPGVARVWLFLHDAGGYRDGGLRSSLSRILQEAAGQESFSTLIAASGPGDGDLGELLCAIGFVPLGTERDALFLHDAYHDIALYRMALQA